MTRAEFEQFLLLYGADADAWPVLLQDGARHWFKTQPERVAEVAKFEHEARIRPMLADDASFARRILQQAARERYDASSGGVFAAIIAELTRLMPRPAYGFAALAVVGFLVGFAAEPISASSGTASTSTTSTTALNNFMYAGDFL